MEPTQVNAAGPSTTGPSIMPNDPRLARCGFAKLQGEGIEFFIRKYEITMGRTSKNSTLDLILGDSTTISRQHATIRYNFDAKCFELAVLGKNGVTVESTSNGTTHLYTPESPPTPLRSRDLLIMGEKRFYFLLPRAMGGQSRKRPRTEPSPAPGPLGAHPRSAPAAPPVQLHHPAQPPSAAGATPGAPTQQPPQAAAAPIEIPAAAPVPALGSSGGPTTASGPAHLPSHQPQDSPQPQASPHAQEPPPLYVHAQEQGAAVADPGGLAVHQHPQYQAAHRDEEDALINSGLPYDNGSSYGYGDANSTFPRGF